MLSARPREKTALMTALLVTLTLGVSACGNSGGEGGGALNRIKEDKVLVAGTTNAVPVSYVDPQTKEAKGIVPDLLREALDRNGMQDVQIKLDAMPFASVIPAIEGERMDVFGDIMGITPEREKVIDYVQPFFINPETVVVAKGNPREIHSWEDMAGKKCGSWEGSIWANWCAELGDPDVRNYPTSQELFQDVALGRVDGGFVDAVTVAGALAENPMLGNKIESANPYALRGEASTVSLGINKNYTDLRDLLSRTFDEMKSDGSMAKIFADYGLDPQTSIAK